MFICTVIKSPCQDNYVFKDHPVNKWVKQSPNEKEPAPGFYYEGSGGFDDKTGLWIHYGGHDGIPQGCHTFICELASGKWEQKFPPTSPPGVCCVDGANVFDFINRKFIFFPGGMLGHGFQWSRGVKLKDSAVWAYDVDENRWINMLPPPYNEPAKFARDVIGGLCSGGTFDPNHQLVISFGGTSGGGAKNSIFVYDYYANALWMIKGSNAPPERDGMGIAYDSKRDKLIVFGSQYLSDDKTYIYDFKLNKWEGYNLNPHPPAIKKGTYSTIPRLAYDSINDVVLCLVWLGENGYESWVFHPSKFEWEKLNPSVEPTPSKSRSRNLCYSEKYNLFILELSTTNNRPELWTYRYADASSKERIVPPVDLRAITESNSVLLSWGHTEKDNVKEYEVYKASADKPWLLDFKKIATVVEHKFEDKNVERGKVYYYHIVARYKNGKESKPSYFVRSQPIVPEQPIVSVLSTNKIEVAWKKHPASDVIGYYLYRGVVSVRTVKKGEPGAWKDNDPKYDEPKIVKVKDIYKIEKLNTETITTTNFVDTIDLNLKDEESADYKYSVYAYIIKAVNKLGVESGPSPYALTLPSEPLNLFCRENGDYAELRWYKNPEKGITGYNVYMLKGAWEIVKVTEKPINETHFSINVGKNKTTRFWITAVDAIGQEGQPSSPAWFNHSYKGFFTGTWHQ